MSANQFLPPTVRLSQAFESENFSGGASGSEITRRSFIKRTGGATVATLVAWNIATQQARADGDNASDNSSDSYGMLCTAPSSDFTSDTVPFGPLLIPQEAGGPMVPMHIEITFCTGKIADPWDNQPYTKPYNYCGFMATASIKVSSDAGNGPKWAEYYVDYGISCNPDDGVITGTAANQPWTTRDVLITVGTTLVTVHLAIQQPFYADTNPAYVHTLDVLTKVSLTYTFKFNGQDIIATWGEHGTLANVFVALPK